MRQPTIDLSDEDLVEMDDDGWARELADIGSIAGDFFARTLLEKLRTP